MDTVKPVPAWKKCNTFFYSVGGHGQGHVADTSMFPAESIKSHNFAGVSSRTITALNGTPNVSSGMQIDDLVHLYTSLEGAKAVSLEQQGVVGYLVITASDAMAIKPGKKLGFMSGTQWQDHAHSAITTRRPASDYCSLVGALIAKPKQKAFLERLAQRYPEEYQLPMPDPPHNIKSVRSSLFWYWLFLDDYLINIRMLLIIRRDQDDNIACPMKQAVTMKALKNKDRIWSRSPRR